MNYTKAKSSTRVLAIDYGDTRIGLALSDIMHIIAKPYKTIINNSYESVISNLQEIILSNSVGEILIGLPVTLKNNNSEQTNKVNAFIEKISKDISIPITTYDERLTSVSAIRSLVQQGIKTGENKGYVDMTAAAIFLQNYLDEKSITQK